MTFTVRHGLSMALIEIDSVYPLKMVDLSMAMLNNQIVTYLDYSHDPPIIISLSSHDHPIIIHDWIIIVMGEKNGIMRYHEPIIKLNVTYYSHHEIPHSYLV